MTSTAGVSSTKTKRCFSGPSKRREQGENVTSRSEATPAAARCWTISRLARAAWNTSSVAAMKACVEAGRCDAPKIYEVRANYPKKLDHPSNETSWPKAKKFCETQGKTLPSEAQWEWAATGGDGRRWPWGNELPATCEFADFTIGPLVSPGGDSGCHGGGTSPVKSHPRGNRVLPTGTLYDLAGNVWEWCLDTYAPYPEEAQTDPLVQNPKVLVHVVRGGGWNRPARGIESAFRGAAVYTYEVGGLGFRCVRNPG